MFWLERGDGKLVKSESTLRMLMPYLMPKRSDATVYFEQKVDVEHVLSYLQKKNGKNAEVKLTFFHVYLAAVVRLLYKWPKLNRFVVGGKLYQREKVSVSFAVKKKMHHEAGMTAVRVEFEDDDTIFDVAKKVDEKINQGRGKKLTTSEKEMSIIKHLPGGLIRALVWLQGFLDGLNLLPAALLKNDPLYASIFVVNVGSLKLNAPFHHLYEYGTTPLFGAIGKIQKEPLVNEQNEVVAKDVVTLRWAYDERIQDGYYGARGLDVLLDYMKHPEKLEKKTSFNEGAEE